MVITTILPVSIIAIVVLLPGLVLDQNWKALDPGTVDIIFKGIFLSPLLAVLLSMLVFAIAEGIWKNAFKRKLGEYLSTVGMWALIGVSEAGVIVVILTILYNSPQGPLALIFDGPVGLSAGILVGTFLWLRKNMKPDTSLRR